MLPMTMTLCIHTGGIYRNYPNHYWYKDKPTRELRNYSMIVAGESTLNKLDSIVQDKLR